MAIKIARNDAREFTKRLDYIASVVQHNWKKMNINADPAVAGKMAHDFCLACDQVSDALEMSVLADEKKQQQEEEEEAEKEASSKEAAVLQREQDEPYMSAFQNINNPILTETDEPYMKSFDEDVSSEVSTRSEQSPAGLNPWADSPKTSESAGGGAAPSTYPPTQFS